MTVSSFKSVQDFNEALININKSLESDKSNLLTDELKIKKKGGFFYGLKVVLLSLLRPFGYDQFSHVKVDNIINKLSDEVYHFHATGKMNKETTALVGRILTQLNVRTKSKYSEAISIFSRAINQLFQPKSVTIKNTENDKIDSKKSKQKIKKLNPKNTEKKRNDGIKKKTPGKSHTNNETFNNSGDNFNSFNNEDFSSFNEAGSLFNFNF